MERSEKDGCQGGAFTLVKRRALVGLTLCAAVLAASYPMLFGLEDYPKQVFYGRDVYSITPASSTATLNSSFVASLANQSWAVAASPEVFVLSSWEGVSVIARGVQLPDFLAIEDASIVEGGGTGDSFVLAGEGFANRRGLGIDSPGILVGSKNPAIASVRVTGIFRSEGPSRDEVIIPFDLAWRLGGAATGKFTAVRLRTTDPDGMIGFLRATGSAFAVASESGTIYLNAQTGEDGRLSGLVFLYPEVWRELGRSYVQSFAQQGANGVRVVVLAFQALITMLAVLGIYAVVWRATKEAGRPIGIMRVTGASPVVITGYLLKEFFVLGSLSMFMGIVAGYAVAWVAGSYGVFYLFSHSVIPRLDISLAMITYAVVLMTTLASTVMCVRFSLRRPPRDLIGAVEPREEEIFEEALPV